MEHLELRIGDATVHLLGSIPGFVPHGKELRSLLARLDPDVVALGIPPEDLPALEALAESDDPASLIPEKATGPENVGGAPGLEGMYGVGVGEEPEESVDEGFAALDPVQARLLSLLERFGEVVLPSPDLQEAWEWSHAHGRSIEALDLDDEAHADVFVRANRLWDVIRSGRLQARLMKTDFEDAATPEELVRRFDAMQTRIPSLRTVEQAREAFMAKRLHEVARGTTVAVVPLARLEGVRAGL